MPQGQSGSILSHIFDMPGWHKLMLGIAMLFAGGGSVGTAADYFSRDLSAQVSSTQPTTQQGAKPSWVTHRVSPWAMRVGFAFIAGLVIGFIFRLFLKIMTLLTLAVMTILVGLSYFNVLNVDLTAAEKKYQSGVSWVTDQGERLTKRVVGHLPDSSSGFLGMFTGFRRRKVSA